MAYVLTQQREAAGKQVWTGGRLGRMAIAAVAVLGVAGGIAHHEYQSHDQSVAAAHQLKAPVKETITQAAGEIISEYDRQRGKGFTIAPIPGTDYEAVETKDGVNAVLVPQSEGDHPHKSEAVFVTYAQEGAAQPDPTYYFGTMGPKASAAANAATSIASVGLTANIPSDIANARGPGEAVVDGVLGETSTANPPANTTALEAASEIGTNVTNLPPLGPDSGDYFGSQ